jgi:oligopeptidase B
MAEPDEAFSVWASRDHSERFIEITSSSFTSSEVYLTDAVNPSRDSMRLVAPRRPKITYSIATTEHDMWIITNENAPNNKLMKAPLVRIMHFSAQLGPAIELSLLCLRAQANFTRNNWVDVIPERKDISMSYLVAYKDYLVVHEDFEGISSAFVLNLKTDKIVQIPVMSSLATTYWSGTEFTSNMVRGRVFSYTMPLSEYEFNMDTGEMRLLFEQNVPGYNKDEYIAVRQYAKSHDGVDVPISLIYKKSLFKGKNNPTKALLVRPMYGIISTTM